MDTSPLRNVFESNHPGHIRRKLPSTPRKSVYTNKAERSLLCCTWGQDGAAAFETSPTNFAHSPAYTPEGFQVVE